MIFLFVRHRTIYYSAFNVYKHFGVSKCLVTCGSEGMEVLGDAKEIAKLREYVEKNPAHLPIHLIRLNVSIYPWKKNLSD
jgi:hypothetical protein